ncbi:uncharacterized protein LOC132706227 [Cylas formicarius]|uniref:uncharacterized protein LOC132706227 n=1 Tax=Cylas formicarius TaxID=197179 RepID=UPI0029589BC8|nr:uncharacterized protein LOC132706227 [Cylas formicarius]
MAVVSFRIIPLCLVMFYFCWAYAVENSAITDDDEDTSETSVWYQLMTTLEGVTGLNSLIPSYTVTLACENITKCTIDPKGDLIWEARQELYDSFFSFNLPDEQASSSIDGCLTTNTEKEAYQSCMNDVRMRMNTYVVLNFEKYLTDRLNAGCDLTETNCYELRKSAV